MKRKAVIAITADTFTTPIAETNFNLAAIAPKDLNEAIIAAGAVPIILPFPYETEKAEELAREQVQLVDGLVFSGGADVDPTLFGEEPLKELGQTTYQRDVYEIALVKEAVKAGKAVLGICRGLQLINIAFGGTVYQDLDSQNPECKIKHEQAADGRFPTHHVTLKDGSRLYSLLGEISYVNSRHHQAARQIASGFEVTAVAQDKVIEGLEAQDKNILAVQWHPENMWEKHPEQFKIFTDLVARAEKCLDK